MKQTKTPSKVTTKPARTVTVKRPKKAPSKTRKLTYK